MELRQASKDEAQADMHSEKDANKGATFGKLQQNVMLGETRY